MTTEKPRILFVSHGHPALVTGGTEHCAYDLFHEFHRAGTAEVYFVACVTKLHRVPGPGSAIQSFNGADNEFLLHVGEFDPFMLAHGIDSRSLDDFGRLLDTVKPDIVHFHHLYLIGAESLALVRNRLPQARIVFTLHDFHPICHRDGLMVKSGSEALCDAATSDACHACFGSIAPARFSLRLHHLQNMLGLVDRFIAPSVFLMQRFDNWGLSEHMVEWIPNGLPDHLQMQLAEARGARNRFGFFGNIAPHKGVLFALDAMRRIDPSIDLTLTIHGGMQYQSSEFTGAFEKGLRQAGDRVRFHGPYRREQVSRMIADIDWVIVPSTWWENAPLTILEGFRHRRPVIAGNVGGMAEMVDHGVNGLMFRHRDAADLGRTMVRAAIEDNLWDRLVAAVPGVPTMAELATRHLALYADLLSTRRQRTA